MQNQDRVGQQLGNYRLVRLLGEGGFAKVYLGEHLHLQSEAAVKVLNENVLSTEDQNGFRTEARTIARLKHPHIVKVMDYGIETNLLGGGTGVPYLVMAYAPDGTLRNRYPHSTIVPLNEIALYVDQIADALQYAHNQFIIHCDVKPENMLIEVSGSNDILLSDFGIAVTGHTSRDPAVIKNTALRGTLAYFAPERLEFGTTSAACDQYALGIVVYEWLTGVRPFEGTQDQVIYMQINKKPPPLYGVYNHISQEVEQVVMKALEKDPARRYPSIKEFANALLAALGPASQQAYQMPGNQQPQGNQQQQQANPAQQGGQQWANPGAGQQQQQANPAYQGRQAWGNPGGQPQQQQANPGYQAGQPWGNPGGGAQQQANPAYQGGQYQPNAGGQYQQHQANPGYQWGHPGGQPQQQQAGPGQQAGQYQPNPGGQQQGPIYVNPFPGYTGHNNTTTSVIGGGAHGQGTSSGQADDSLTGMLQKGWHTLTQSPGGWLELDWEFARLQKNKAFREFGLILNVISAIIVGVLSVPPSPIAAIFGLFFSLVLFFLCICFVNPKVSVFCGLMVALYWGYVGIVIGGSISLWLPSMSVYEPVIVTLLGIIFLSTSAYLHVRYVLNRLP